MMPARIPVARPEEVKTRQYFNCRISMKSRVFEILKGRLFSTTEVILIFISQLGIIDVPLLTSNERLQINMFFSILCWLHIHFPSTFYIKSIIHSILLINFFSPTSCKCVFGILCHGLWYSSCCQWTS